MENHNQTGLSAADLLMVFATTFAENIAQNDVLNAGLIKIAGCIELADGLVNGRNAGVGFHYIRRHWQLLGCVRQKAAAQ